MSKQSSLFGFIALNKNKAKNVATIEISDDSLTSPDIISTSTPVNGLAGGKPKFQFQPVKRKSNSLIEISDGEKSCSPTKIEPLAKRRQSEDMFEESDASDNRSIEPKRDANIDRLYSKYGSFDKNKETFELSIEDKLDLDKELNSNSTYVNAMKKLNENLKEIENSPKKEIPLATPQSGKSKFKFTLPSKAVAKTPNQVPLVPTQTSQSKDRFEEFSKTTLKKEPLTQESTKGSSCKSIANETKDLKCDISKVFREERLSSDVKCPTSSKLKDEVRTSQQSFNPSVAKLPSSDIER